MPRYWVIAPFRSEQQEMFDKVWQFDLSNNVISIGWERVGNVAKMSHDELVAAVAAGCTDKSTNDFLREEGLLADVEAVAVKRVLAVAIARMMKRQRISKSGWPAA